MKLCLHSRFFHFDEFLWKLALRPCEACGASSLRSLYGIFFECMTVNDCKVMIHKRKALEPLFSVRLALASVTFRVTPKLQLSTWVNLYKCYRPSLIKSIRRIITTCMPWTPTLAGPQCHKYQPCRGEAPPTVYWPLQHLDPNRVQDGEVWSM